MQSLGRSSLASHGGAVPGGYVAHHPVPLSRSSPHPSAQQRQHQQHQSRSTTSAVVRHRDNPSGLTNSYHAADTSSSASPSPPITAAAVTVTSPLEALSPALLSDVQRDYPTVYAALSVYEKAVRHHRERFAAKEAELLRCIGVGEELLGQIDALKQRCETLASERDAAVSAAEPHTTASTQLGCERAAQRDEVAEAARRAEEEKRESVQAHAAQCAHLQQELQDALQHTAIAHAERREVETTLAKTRAQLQEAEAHMREMEDAHEAREAAYAAQRERDVQQQHAVLQRQLALLQQQSEVDRETVLAESTVELERLQRALVRAEKEVQEHHRAAQQASSTTLLGEPRGAATVETASLRRQIRQLEDVNHDLQLQLRRRAAEPGEGRLVIAAASEENRTAVAAGAASRSSTSTSGPLQASSRMVETMNGTSLALQQRLQEQNAHLRDKLQSVSRQAQADVDKAHEARLELQQHVSRLEAQLRLLRTSVVGGLEEELRRARENADAAEAHSAELQEIADALEARAIALHDQLTQISTALKEEKDVSSHLRDQLREAQDDVAAAQRDAEAGEEEAARKDAIIAQQQREKQQLIAALRTLQAETATIEGALTELNVRHEAGVVSGETNLARLQERCVLLEHDAETAQEERLALRSRLRDAEEAVAVLTDAQRVSQEAVRDAQRRAGESAERARLDVEQLRGQQQQWMARATAAEAEVERLRCHARDVVDRLRDGEGALMRAEEAERRSQEKVATLTKELRLLREAQGSRESASQEQWRQQYAQNAADREQLIAHKEQQIQDLYGEVQGLRAAATRREEEAHQLQRQRQQAQSALSEAVTSMASYKGRLQALEEELARVEKERAEARAEVQRLAAQRRERGADAEGDGAVQLSAVAAQRVGELEAQLASRDAALHTADAQRQRAQTTLLQMLLPPSAPSPPSPQSTHGWDALVEVLDGAARQLISAAAAPASNNTAPVTTAHDEEDGAAGENACLTLDAALPEACQRAAAAVLRAARDWVESLHDENELRSAALRHTITTLFAPHDTDASHSHAQEPGTLQGGGGGTSPHAAEVLRERLTTALRTFAGAVLEVRKGWAAALAAQTAQRAYRHAEHHHAQLAELNALVAEKEAACVAQQHTIDALHTQQADASRQRADLQRAVDQLHADVATRDAHLADLERRLEARSTAAQAEREEWVAKWQESQRHRSREREEYDTALRALRTQLADGGAAAAASAEAQQKEAGAVQQQLRTQLQALQKSAAAAELALQQQVQALSQDKTQATQSLRRVRTVVTELEERVRCAEASLQTKTAELEAAHVAVAAAKREHHQALANSVAAEAFGHETLAQSVASLQSQLTTARQDAELLEKTHAAERAELQALRRVNASLESRLAEVEEDRAPLRQQLHSLLSFADS